MIIPYSSVSTGEYLCDRIIPDSFVSTGEYLCGRIIPDSSVSTGEYLCDGIIPDSSVSTGEYLCDWIIIMGRCLNGSLPVFTDIFNSFIGVNWYIPIVFKDIVYRINSVHSAQQFFFVLLCAPPQHILTIVHVSVEHILQLWRTVV